MKMNGTLKTGADALDALFMFAQGPEHLQVPIRQRLSDPSL